MSWRDIMPPSAGDPTPNIPTIPKTPEPTAPEANIGDIGDIGEKGSAPESALPPDVVAAVNAWLDAIGEHHAEDRAELLTNCARDPEALAGLLGIIAEAGIITASPSPEPTPEPVTCGGCLHFRADEVGDGSGLGACRIGAPASRRTPALWPNAPHLCSDHEETAP